MDPINDQINSGRG